MTLEGGRLAERRVVSSSALPGAILVDGEPRLEGDSTSEWGSWRQPTDICGVKGRVHGLNPEPEPDASAWVSMRVMGWLLILSRSWYVSQNKDATRQMY